MLRDLSGALRGLSGVLNALLGAISVVRALMDIGSAQRVSGRAEHDIQGWDFEVGSL